MFRSATKRVNGYAALVTVLAMVFVSVATVRSADRSLLDKVRACDVAAVRALLEDDADPNGADETGATPLMHAAAVGSLELMRVLLDNGAAVNSAAADGTTALMWATADAARVRLLLDRGADLNATAKDGTTALVAAAQRGAADVVRLLLERKADPMASGDQGALLFQAAFSTTNSEVRELLAAAGLTAKHFGQVAPAIGRVDYVDHDLLTRYLALGGDPNLKVPMVTVQMPLVGYAAMVTGPQTVQMLIERGADVNATSNRGSTPLMLAAASDHASPETVRTLLARGARVDALDDSGRSALDWAMLQGETPVARLLREAGAPSAPVPSTATTALVREPMPLRVAVQKAVSSMDAIGPAFNKGTGCVSCHNQSLPAMARQLAASRGVTVPAAVAAHPDDATLKAWTPRRNASFVGRCGGSGYIPTVTYGLASMAAEGTAPNSVTDAATVCLSSRQSADGSWRVNDTRPPLSGNEFLYTALAIRSLDVYAPPALRGEMQARVERARTFLRQAQPNDTQDEAFKLMGLVWAGASHAEVAAQASRLRALQRADGGWGQTPLMATDAYATGQSLYALQLAGVAPNHKPYQAGVHYLLRNQREDGSWYVQSRGFGFQPYVDFGFPHGKSQFLSAAATSWAVMALAPAM